MNILVNNMNKRLLNKNRKYFSMKKKNVHLKKRTATNGGDFDGNGSLIWFYVWPFSFVEW